jgi:hypothetical protein
MNPDELRRHESVDHVDPTDSGLMDPTHEDVPGTGIMGDETIVHDLDDGKPPGIYPDPPAHTGGVAHPGPTPAAVEDDMAFRESRQASRGLSQTGNSTRREGT